MVSVGQESGMTWLGVSASGSHDAAVLVGATVSSEGPSKPGSPLRLTCVVGGRIQVLAAVGWMLSVPSPMGCSRGWITSIQGNKHGRARKGVCRLFVTSAHVPSLLPYSVG